MSREERIARLLTHYFECAWNAGNLGFDRDNRAEIRELASLICTLPDSVEGQPGDGSCICAASPEYQEIASKRMGFTDWVRHGGKAILDHRCPKHGEAAQPRIWGRHKERTLPVTAVQWRSLGVTYPEKPVITDYQEERF